MIPSCAGMAQSWKNRSLSAFTTASKESVTKSIKGFVVLFFSGPFVSSSVRCESLCLQPVLADFRCSSLVFAWQSFGGADSTRSPRNVIL